MKKKIYMFQVNYTYGDAAYLPYAVGAIAAFAWSHPEIQEAYSLEDMFYIREEAGNVLKKIESPYLVAFSNYLWNFEYNKALAKQIKALYPDCLIVFGGHHVPPDTSLLEEENYIDFLLHGEGEEPFRELLLCLLHGGCPDTVHSLSYRCDGGTCVQTQPLAFYEREEYPSPYAMGLFDRIVEESSYAFSAILETNRGCPFSCAYCDWGCLKHKKIRSFSMARIKGDIDWISAHKIPYVWAADANFGIFDRDSEIADYLIEAKQKTGYPEKFRVNYTKNSDQKVFELNRKLNDSDMSKGATLSFQSLSETVLANIGRKNLDMESFSNLMNLYNRYDIPTYSEIIVALPGETLESYCKGIGKLLQAGQHTSINMFNCELLPNSNMGDAAYREKYGIETVQTPLIQYHCNKIEESICEYSNIVVKTDTMSREDWIQANLFSVTVLSCHCLGLVMVFAMYLNEEKKVPYHIFYGHLIQWAFQNQSTVLGQVLTMIDSKLHGILDGTDSWLFYNEDLYGDIQWPFEEGVFLECVRQFDLFYEEITDYLKTYDIDGDIFKDLMQYQKAIVKVPAPVHETLTFAYDAANYVHGIFINRPVKLAKRKNIVAVNSSGYDGMKAYAREAVMFGRRGGKNIHTQFDIKYID